MGDLLAYLGQVWPPSTRTGPGRTRLPHAYLLVSAAATTCTLCRGDVL